MECNDACNTCHDIGPLHGHPLWPCNTHYTHHQNDACNGWVRCEIRPWIRNPIMKYGHGFEKVKNSMKVNNLCFKNNKIIFKKLLYLFMQYELCIIKINI